MKVQKNKQGERVGIESWMFDDVTSMSTEAIGRAVRGHINRCRVNSLSAFVLVVDTKRRGDE